MSTIKKDGSTTKIKTGEVWSITCDKCKTVFNLGKKGSCPPYVHHEGITCPECLDLIENIKEDETLEIVEILQED